MRIRDAQGFDLYDPSHRMADPTGRIFRSSLPNVATEFQLASNTAYFVYVGRVTQPIILQYVQFYVSTAGAGTYSGEVGLFSTPTPPNNETLTLAKLSVVTSADTDPLTSTGVKFNSNANFSYTAPPGTYLWAGIRVAGFSTFPKLSGLSMDFDDGLVLTTASAGVLTGAGPWAGAQIIVPSSLNTAIAPDLRILSNISA
jgi:hypothetical protein